MSKLEELALRCEQATGPDRELDVAIARSLGVTVWKRNDEDTGNYETTYWKYTASLDAAIALLDGHGVLMHLSDIGADGLPYARVGCPNLDDVPICSGIASCTLTTTSNVAGLALALCAAALRARAQQEAAK
jgi:hypothetical protein